VGACGGHQLGNLCVTSLGLSEKVIDEVATKTAAACPWLNPQCR
jgi:hypothetical protein